MYTQNIGGRRGYTKKNVALYLVDISKKNLAIFVEACQIFLHRNGTVPCTCTVNTWFAVLGHGKLSGASDLFKCILMLEKDEYWGLRAGMFGNNSPADRGLF